MRVALDEIKAGRFGNDETRQERGWKLFLQLSKGRRKCVKQSTSQTLWIFVILRMLNMQRFSKNTRGVSLRDNIKDERGYKAAFVDQSASAPLMAAAKFVDTISKLL